MPETRGLLRRGQARPGSGEGCGGREPVTSCDLHVLVYEAAEPVSSQWPNCRVAAWGSAVCRRLLSERPVWAMKVVVLGELTQHCCEVARSGAQEVVEALPAQGADEALRDRVRPRCPDRGANDADVGAGEHGVERGVESLWVPRTLSPHLTSTFAACRHRHHGPWPRPA